MPTTEGADPDAVHGHCEPRFAPVRDALATIMAAGTEIGAALAVCVGTRDVRAGSTGMCAA